MITYNARPLVVMPTKQYSNIEQLSEKTGIAKRTIRSLYQQRKISGIKAGHRTLLFDAEKVCAELARFEVKAVQ